MSRILRFERREGPSNAGAVSPGNDAPESSVNVFPRLNLRKLARDWAEDCIRVGLARPKSGPPAPCRKR